MDRKKESLSKKFGRAYSGFFNTDSGVMAGAFFSIILSLPATVFLLEDTNTQAPQQGGGPVSVKMAELEKKVEQVAVLESMANSFARNKKEYLIAETNYQQAVEEFQTELLLDGKISEELAEQAVALLQKKTGRLPIAATELQEAMVFRDEARAEFMQGAFLDLPPEQQAALIKSVAVEKDAADSDASLFSALGMGFGAAGGIVGLCLAGNRIRRRIDDGDKAERHRLWEEEHKVRERTRQKQKSAEVVPVPAPVKKKPDHFRL